MPVTLTYDATLSRVRITGVTYLNANPFFETTATPWTALGGTVARSTAQAHEGVASLLLTPDGVTATVEARSVSASGVVAGQTYRVSAWVRCAVARSVNANIVWRDAGGVFLSSAGAVSISVAATTWALIEVSGVAPASAAQGQISVSMGSTPPASNLLHIDQAVFGPAAPRVERSTNQVTWTVVRGGAAAPVNAAVSLDDYEFSADVPNYYRVTGQTPTSITPTLGSVWLKSIARPFLNRQVTVRDFSEVSRPSRAGVFDVVGRSFPVAVNDVRGSRRWTLDVNTGTPQEAVDLDLLFASGDTLLIQVPADAGRLSATPGGYVTVGDVRETTPPTYDLRSRIFSLPCTEVAAPGPDVVGATSNWQTVLNTYATWADLMAAKATWADVLELVGDPTDVVVL